MANPTLKFAQEARRAGVEKMLIHTSPSVARRTGITPEEMKQVSELGYLTSTYDDYTDVFALEPGRQVDETHDRVPENVVLRADGARMPAWLTWDKKQGSWESAREVFLRTYRNTCKLHEVIAGTEISKGHEYSDAKFDQSESAVSGAAGK